MPQLIVKLKGRELQRMPVEKLRTSIGRDASSDLVLDNIGVSRDHAAVVYEGGAFFAVDSGSSNGIFVNDTQRTRHELLDGDEIRVGKFQIEFSAAGGVPPDMLNQVERADDPFDEKPAAVLGADPTTALSLGEIQRLSARLQEAESQLAQQGSGPAPMRSALIRARRESDSLEKRNRTMTLLLLGSFLVIVALIVALVIK